MQTLSGLAYQERLNPWINKNVHVAHGIPLVFPVFRAAIANEVFLFAAGILFAITLFLGFSLVFSLPIFSSNNFNENTFLTMKKFQAVTIFSILLIAYFRIVYFIFSKLNHEFLVATLGFLVFMSIPYIAENLPALVAWLGGKTIHYLNPSVPTLIMFFFVACALMRKLLQQFHEAKDNSISKLN